MKLSATAITLFKQCPKAFWFKYRKHIHTVEPSEPMTLGSLYHNEALAPFYSNVPAENIRDRITKQCYQSQPDRWARLLSAFDAYVLDPPLSPGKFQVEVPFECPIPDTDVTVRGVFDLIIEHDTNVVLWEHKSTSSAFGDSLYWQQAQRSVQLSVYYWALRNMYPGKSVDIFFNVWHKAGFRRKHLSAKDSKAFLDSGQYLGYELDVPADDAQVFKGKNNDQLQETPEMFYARLYQRYTTQPAFDCRPVVRLAADREYIEAEIRKLIKVIEYMDASDTFYCNEDACTKFSGCDYRPICDNHLDVEYDKLPDTLRRRD